MHTIFLFLDLYKTSLYSLAELENDTMEISEEREMQTPSMCDKYAPKIDRKSVV